MCVLSQIIVPHKLLKPMNSTQLHFNKVFLKRLVQITGTALLF